MSSSRSTSTSKRRGQYSVRACNGCRRRRIKCDGNQPVCETCESHGRECEWSVEADARRPVTKQLVDSLNAKIQALEAELEGLGGRLAQVTHDRTTEKSLEGAMSTVSHRDSDAVSTGGTNPMLQLAGDISEVDPPAHSTPQLPAVPMYQYIFQIDTGASPAEQPREVQLSLVCDWSRYLPQLPDAPLTRLEHDTLLLRCFKYGTSWLLGLVPELFLHDMLYSLTTKPALPRPRLQHYTPFLHCSILAFASAFSDDPTVRASETRTRFADHAKQWLDEEFIQPMMSLVSALVLLAEYHCGIGQQETGYMYMGMSLRTARLLTSGVADTSEGGELLSIFPESITRDWYIWSAFAHDKIMAIEFRRDYDMPVPHSKISLPYIVAELDNQPWPLESPVDSTAHAPPARLITQALQESSKLTIIASRIIEMLLSGQRVQERDILNIHLRLDKWFNSLPEKLLVWARSASPLPHVIVLHVCYWWLLIVLHEPLYRATNDLQKRKSAEARAEQRFPIADLTVKVYDRAAHKIVQLLTMFDNQYGLRFFPRNMIGAISSCGTALVRELTSTHPGAQKKRSDASAGVSTCISALRTISSTWPIAQQCANDLQLRLQEVFTPVFPLPQVDGLTDRAMAEDEQDLDGAADISSAFYQYMHQWGSMPNPADST